VAAIMEEAADSILASTDDPSLNNEALRWSNDAMIFCPPAFA
jgi:hypothetical protein